MKSENAKNIVRHNMKMAVLDCMGYNPFKNSEQKNKEIEDVLDKTISQRLEALGDDSVQTFAVAVVSGHDIGYDKSMDDFYIL